VHLISDWKGTTDNTQTDPQNIFGLSSVLKKYAWFTILLTMTKYLLQDTL
jgi:hypothetical protein